MPGDAVLPLNPALFLTGVLVFVRLLALFSVAPVLGSAQVPFPIRISAALAMSFVVAPVSPAAPLAIADQPLALGVAVLREVMVGLAIGFAAQLLFLAVSVAGEVMDVQMGFSMATLVNPLFNAQVSLLQNMLIIVATLLFVLMNGHHVLIGVLVRSVELAPPGAGMVGGSAAEGLISVTARLFVLGLQMAAPVMLSLLLTEVVLGLVGRSAPQMNLLMLGFPVKLAVGVTMLGISLPYLLPGYRLMFGPMLEQALRAVLP